MKATTGERGFYPIDIEAITQEMAEAGWRECTTCTPPAATEEEQQTGLYIPVYTQLEDKYVQGWEWQKDNAKIRNTINDLKAELTAGDYMWVKCWEASIMGRDYPYTNDELAAADAQRENIRKRINDLEKMLY